LDRDVQRDSHPYIDRNSDFHGYQHIDFYLHVDGHAHVQLDPDDDGDLDGFFHSDFYAQHDRHIDSVGDLYRHTVLHPERYGDLDRVSDWDGYFHGDRDRYIYRHGDECSFRLPGCDPVGALSQPGDQSFLADPFRSAVELFQDVALDHHHERESLGGFWNRVGLRTGHLGLGPTRQPRETSGQRALLFPSS
jgi:hypothetical protein